MEREDAAQEQAPAHAGASFEAIAHHYDVGTEFFRIWLDKELVYSAARWKREAIGARESLERAQENKLDFHLNAVGAAPGASLLEIGCGWGAMLARSRRRFGVASVVGLHTQPRSTSPCRGNEHPGRCSSP